MGLQLTGNQPSALQPSSARYSQEAFTQKWRNSDYRVSGVRFDSKAEPNAHFVGEGKVSRTGVEGASKGVSTVAGYDNIGFVVRTITSRQGELVVVVWPYPIDEKKGGNFYHSGLAKQVQRICGEILASGVNVNGKIFAPRAVIGIYETFDLHGSSPLALIKPKNY